LEENDINIAMGDHGGGYILFAWAGAQRGDRKSKAELLTQRCNNGELLIIVKNNSITSAGEEYILLTL
jgi:hypothetical protein